MTVAAAAAAAGAWLWALLGRANTADACVLALVLIFFWVDVAKVRGVVCLADGEQMVRVGNQDRGSGGP